MNRLLVGFVILGILVIVIGVFAILRSELFIFKNNKPIFRRDEPILMELKLGSTKRELIEKIGKPQKIKKEWWGAYGDYVEYYYYDWGTVLLAPSNENDLSNYII